MLLFLNFKRYLCSSLHGAHQEEKILIKNFSLFSSEFNNILLFFISSTKYPFIGSSVDPIVADGKCLLSFNITKTNTIEINSVEIPKIAIFFFNIIS